MQSTKGPIYKSQSMDKWDAYMPNKPGFVHDDYVVGGEHSKFHMPNQYMYRDNGPGWSAGVNKKLHKASAFGVFVDHMYVGKTEQ